MGQPLRDKLGSLVTRRSRPSRWWYLPFLLVQGALAFFALAAGLPGKWDYLALSMIFLAQTVRPTVLGWWGALLGWFSLNFLMDLHDRLAYGIPGFTAGYLVVWGVLPLIPLWLIRPRRKGAGGGAH